MGIMMNSTRFKILITGFFMLFLCFSISAQQFATHAVKKGETLESIAKQYRVTPFNILKYNKEIVQGKPLVANTVLVIPMGPNSTDSNVPVVKSKTKEVVKGSAEIQENPIGFTSYRVRRKDTLYGIAKRFNITVEDIKRYNKELYSGNLKKGMNLRIPKFRRVNPADVVKSAVDFEMYTVKPKETRWSIANMYGITIDRMLELNPELSKNNNYLMEGQQLKLPKIAGSTVENQRTQLFISYTVPPKKGFMALEREFGTTETELKVINPELIDGGLKEGMVIRIPQKKADTTAVNTDNFIFYEVKKGEAEYGLTRKLGVNYRELIALNPKLTDGLKAGMVLKIPVERAQDLEVKNSLVLDRFSLIDSIQTSNKPNLLFLLPFRTDKIDVSNKEMAKDSMAGRKDTKYSLGIYTGAMVALDSIKKLGVSVKVRTFDTQLNATRAKDIMLRENLNNISAIIGPLDSKSLKEVALAAGQYDVPVIAPIASNSDISLRNVYFTIPSDEVLRSKMIAYVDENRTEENMVIIADENNKGTQRLLLEKFPKAKILNLKNNISLDIEKVKQIVSAKQNWVFLESDNANTIYHVSSVLNSTISDTVKVKMFTTNRNKAFENDVISSSHLSNLGFTYPSVEKELGSNSFVKMYRRKYGMEPDRYAVRGFDITFDILLKLAYKNNLFEAGKNIGETSYTANKFNYTKQASSGYYNQSAYIVSYDKMMIVEAE
ncbi:MAG: LysM repeat protein/ABC-type branched-subunit amino acid transport system substrate-binding protein [Sediminicola sp.]|jgi:LysM repeat protein/ABC-type branched-subunit amino acid transport system substrate-binding protein